ncbi:hypothetical protein [Halorientalis pallida]|uniref:hypothetical protein n=1 Tax=Halorientalis pallida TaxID=2479928 RepID=UPI00187D28EA|nr:hypothetical protein [Halorientalis pallida]
MSERPPLKEQAATHLEQALSADDPGTKNFHIRSALQFEECIEAIEQADHAHAD